MQDRTRIHNDSEEAFLNDSWDKMSTMLDTEMPVMLPNVSSRPIYPRKAMLVLLLLIGSVGVFLFQKTYHSASKDAAQLDAVSIEHRAAMEARIAHAEESERKENTMAYSNNPTFVGAGTLTSVTKPEVNVAVKIPDVVETASLALNIPLAQNALPDLHNIEEISLSEKNNLDQSAFSEEALLAINASVTSPLLIPSNHHPELYGNPLPGKSLQVLSVVNRKWTYGLMAGIQQEKINQGFGGFAITALVNRQLAKNFTLEGGLSYSLTQFNNSQLNNAPGIFNPNNGSGSNQGGIDGHLIAEPYNPSDANQVDPIYLGSASWLSIPLLLTYQPGRRWRVNMGVEYAQLLQAKEQKIIGGATEKSENITNLIEENNIMALSGVTYMLQKNLALDIRYQYGFTDLSKANPKFIDQTDTRSALQWSLVYYFNAK